MSGEKLVEWSIKKNSNIKKLLRLDSNKRNGHIKFYEYLINNLNKKNTLKIDEAMKSLKIINSIYRSSTYQSSIEIKKIRFILGYSSVKVFK